MSEHSNPIGADIIPVEVHSDIVNALDETQMCPHYAALVQLTRHCKAILVLREQIEAADSHSKAMFLYRFVDDPIMVTNEFLGRLYDQTDEPDN
jgi:hypothetical protein